MFKGISTIWIAVLKTWFGPMWPAVMRMRHPGQLEQMMANQEIYDA